VPYVDIRQQQVCIDYQFVKGAIKRRAYLSALTDGRTDAGKLYSDLHDGSFDDLTAKEFYQTFLPEVSSWFAAMVSEHSASKYSTFETFWNVKAVDPPFA
jgi:hypothetical protein